jgi:hypothetical protein
MNDTQGWLAGVRPRHNPAENALIANMRDDPNIPWLSSLAAMRHYRSKNPPPSFPSSSPLHDDIAPILGHHSAWISIR